MGIQEREEKEDEHEWSGEGTRRPEPCHILLLVPSPFRVDLEIMVGFWLVGRGGCTAAGHTFTNRRASQRSVPIRLTGRLKAP